MDNSLSSRMLEIATKAAFPVEIKHDNGQDLITIGFNKETKEYGISFSKNGRVNDKKRGVSRADMISYMNNPGFETDMQRIVEEIEEKERAYETLRMRLMKELEELDLPASEKTELASSIEFLTTLPEYSTVIPRIGIGSRRDGEYILNNYVRVGNEYDRSQGIALQFISRVTGPTGSNTNYKRIELRELAGLLKERNEKERKQEGESR